VSNGAMSDVTTEPTSESAPDASPSADAAILLDLRQAADFVGVTRRRLDLLRRSGDIPAHRTRL